MKYKRVLNWTGSKWSMTEEILKLFPKHKVYIEPFFGSGALFFHKEPSKTELINDLDNEVYNLFKVIRDYPLKLSKSILLTPYSEKEYKESYNRKNIECDDIENARLFLIRSNMARGGMQAYSSSWKHTGIVRAIKNSNMGTTWSKLPDYILNAAERLKDAEIFNRDGMSIIEKYQDPEVFIFIDTPYLGDLRRQKYYNCEMYYTEDHINFLEVVSKCKSKMLICGYDSELYNKYLVGWNKKQIDATAEIGKKIETFWYNYELDNEQLSLF